MYTHASLMSRHASIHTHAYTHIYTHASINRYIHVYHSICIYIQEINLREAKTAVGWRKAVMDRKDRIMSSMEDCLRYVVGNLRESNKLFPVKDGGNPYTTTSTIGEYRHLRACMYVSFDRPLGGNEEGRRERREGGRERREGGKEEVLTIMMMAVILTVLQIVIRLTGRIDDGADDGAVREYGGSPHSG
eukprot:GHVU01167358.1.p2 GENE.GHVU01167358.1~~GHVU01167358.1.p2  ORF type:complete len:190 (+),score=18.53 GHVU01167358.1:814-1383(+)